jgi:hypothetical protein
LHYYLSQELSIEILAYCQTKDSSTELLITNTSTIPEGSRGDFIPRFFLLVNQGTQWELTKELNDDELTNWVLKNDKEITVVSNEFYLILISKLCNWEQA